MCLGEFTNIRITMEADEATVRGVVRHDHTSLIHSLCFPFFFFFLFTLSLSSFQSVPSFLPPSFPSLPPFPSSSFLQYFLPAYFPSFSGFPFIFTIVLFSPFQSHFLPFFLLSLLRPFSKTSFLLLSFIFLSFPFIFTFV